MPSSEEIQAISPLAQIRKGNYRTPTYIIHGTEDDLVPCSQSEETIKALKEQGVKAGFYRLEGAEHLFDTFGTDHGGGGERAVREAYQWLIERLFEDEDKEERVTS